MRHIRKVDTNQKEIVRALRRVGCTVVDLSDVGRGVPDLLVSRAYRMWLLEVKAEKGTITPEQHAWNQRWSGPPPVIVRTVDEALAAVGLEIALANQSQNTLTKGVPNARDEQ